MKSVSKYQKLAEEIRQQINDGIYKPGELVETENKLSEKYNLSRQTVRKALDVLEEEGIIERKHGSGTYVKGKKMLANKTMTIGVVVTFVTEYIFPLIIKGIESELSKAGYSMKLSVTSNSVANERRILQEYIENPVDGLIIEGTKTHLSNPNIDLYYELSEKGVQYTFINGYYPELKDANYVITDDYGASKEATNYLISKGHKRIVGVFKSDDMQGERRYKGYIQALIDNGLQVHDEDIFWFTTITRKAIFDGVTAGLMLDSIGKSTAVVCYNDEIAVDLYNLLHNSGFKVPQDVSLISFDNSTYSEINKVKITSMNHPKEESGKLVANQIISMIDDKPYKSYESPMKLVEKDSVRNI